MTITKEHLLASLWKLRNGVNDTEFQRGINFGIALGYIEGFVPDGHQGFIAMCRLQTLACSASSYGRNDAAKRLTGAAA